MKKSRVWQAIVPGTQTKPQDTLQIRKTPWHGVTKQPPAPVPGPNVTPEPNEKIKGLAGASTVPGTQAKPQDTLQIRKTPWHGVTKQPPAVPLPGPNVTPEPNQSRVWQAIVPGTQTKPQDTLQIRKTPWRGVTKQPPAVPLPRPNVTPEPNEKIKGLAGNCSRHTNLATRHPSNQENSLARRDETASCGQTSLLNRMKKSRVWQAIVPGTQNKPQDTLQIRKTPWHGVTKQPPAVPLPGQTSLLNRMKKSRVWQAIVPGAQNKKPSHKTPFKRHS